MKLKNKYSTSLTQEHVSPNGIYFQWENAIVAFRPNLLTEKVILDFQWQTCISVAKDIGKFLGLSPKKIRQQIFSGKILLQNLDVSV